VLSEGTPREVPSCLPEILPVVTHLEEVASAARLADVIDNRDIVPFVPRSSSRSSTPRRSSR
jgi:hypothetical protein